MFYWQKLWRLTKNALLSKRMQSIPVVFFQFSVCFNSCFPLAVYISEVHSSWYQHVLCLLLDSCSKGSTVQSASQLYFTGAVHESSIPLHMPMAISTSEREGLRVVFMDFLKKVKQACWGFFCLNLLLCTFSLVPEEEHWQVHTGTNEKTLCFCFLSVYKHFLWRSLLPAKRQEMPVSVEISHFVFCQSIACFSVNFVLSSWNFEVKSYEVFFLSILMVLEANMVSDGPYLGSVSSQTVNAACNGSKLTQETSNSKVVQWY